MVERSSAAAAAAAAATAKEKKQLKDRVATIMALRKQTEAPKAKAQKAESPSTDDLKTESPKAEAARSTGSKESSGLGSKFARSMTSLASCPSGGKIQHDDVIINLRGYSKSPRHSAAKSPRKTAAKATEATDIATKPSNPSTPKRAKTLQHEAETLKLGEGYVAPPDARSIQKDAVDIDNTRVRLGVKYRTQGRNE